MCDNSVDAQNMTVMDFMLHQYAVKLKTIFAPNNKLKLFNKGFLPEYITKKNK